MQTDLSIFPKEIRVSIHKCEITFLKYFVVCKLICIKKSNLSIVYLKRIEISNKV